MTLMEKLIEYVKREEDAWQLERFLQALTMTNPELLEELKERVDLDALFAEKDFS